MDAATVETAPAPPAPAEPIAAEPAAAPDRGARPDFRAFDEARIAKALGRTTEKPAAAPVLEKPAAESVPQGDDAPAVDAAGQPITEGGKPLSKRQHDANERIRLAVERGIAEARRQDQERIAALEAKIAGRPVETPAADTPAAEPALPAKPKMAEFEARIGLDGGFDSYADALEAFQDAREAWRNDVARVMAKQAAAAAARDEAQRLQTTRLQTHADRERALTATVPDYPAKVAALRETLIGAADRSVLTQALFDSDQSARLLLHFAEHPDDLTRIGALGMTNLPAALREMGKLEAQYDTPTAEAAIAAPPAVSRKTVTSAPEPPVALGTRPAEPTDPIKAAVARKDFRAFDELRVAKDLAARRRR